MPLSKGWHAPQVTRDALLRDDNMKEAELKADTNFGSGYPGGEDHR